MQIELSIKGEPAELAGVLLELAGGNGKFAVESAPTTVVDAPVVTPAKAPPKPKAKRTRTKKTTEKKPETTPEAAQPPAPAPAEPEPPESPPEPETPSEPPEDVPEVDRAEIMTLARQCIKLAGGRDFVTSKLRELGVGSVSGTVEAGVGGSFHQSLKEFVSDHES